MFLDGVVGQVDEGVVVVFGGVLEGTKAQVALFEEEDFVVLCEQRPDANVELALVDQHRALYVLLHHEAEHFETAGLCLFALEVQAQGVVCLEAWTLRGLFAQGLGFGLV
jgi:hypothetical protein